MGVSSLPNRISYVGDGATTAFSFPYYFTAKADLFVYLYDTLLGGVTLQALATDYTISGSVNAQGLYQTGGTVTMVVAPISTSILVIVRSPTMLQNYALLQNGQISSSALVQQLDYLTLLVQRLEDQVSRSSILSDGMGATFDPTLPTNLVLNPGSFMVVNAPGNAWAMASPLTGITWQRVDIPFTSLQTASTTDTVTAFSLPAGYILMGVAIKHSIAFAGTLITDVTLDVGISTDKTKFISAFDVLAAVSSTNFDYLIANYIADFTNATNITLRASSVGANLSALSAGYVSVYYLIQKVGV